jgi:hypothetical protein
MGRQRVSKGKIIQKKDQKVIEVLMTLPSDVSGDDFVSKFREVFPEDWKKVQKRYDEHERLTPKGKSHPMAHPHQYMLNASRKLRQLYAGGADLGEILNELSAPKPKFVEGRPDNLERLLQQAGDLTSYELRVTAVNSLGKHKCDESIAALHDRLSNDPVYDVRETAYLRLARFGVEAERPRKDMPHTDPEMNEKISHVVSQLKPGFSDDKLDNKFKALYPEEYDLQRYQLKNRFKHWLKNVVKSLPKT